MKAVSLPERPPISTRNHLRSVASRRPGLGFAGLLQVVPVAVVFAIAVIGGGLATYAVARALACAATITAVVDLAFSGIVRPQIVGRQHFRGKC